MNSLIYLAMQFQVHECIAGKYTQSQAAPQHAHTPIIRQIQLVCSISPLSMLPLRQRGR